MKTTWDYTDLAEAYLKRPEYSASAIHDMLSLATVSEGARVCDIGAGVGHLTVALAERKLKVVAVEPNNAMRKLGMERTREFEGVSWIEANAENTNQDDQAFDMVTFGSSFNVVDHVKALKETHRILKPHKWFACMWNHRDLENPIQSDLEKIISDNIPDYNYGTRREDQTATIEQSRLFDQVQKIEGHVQHKVGLSDYIEAWRSHATLQRQAGDRFEAILKQIDNYLTGLGENFIDIPYTTRIWVALKIEK